MKTLIPPPIVTIVFLFVIFFTKDLFRFSVTLPSSLGFIIIFAGLVIIFIAARQFKAANTTINPIKPENASVLVNKGIFSYSRNPMYLGLAGILTGVTLFLQAWLGFVAIPIFIMYINKYQIAPEEKILTEKFKDDYISYCSTVKRWI